MLLVWGMIVVLVLAIIFLPKKLTFKECMVVFPVVGFFAWIAHILIGVMADRIDFGPTGKVEFSDWLLVTFVPALIAILFLNLKKTEKNFLYSILWTAVSLLIELFLVQSGYMKYKQWHIWYSIPGYLAAYLLLPWYYNLAIKRS